MTHRPSGGWVAPRILREHLEGPLFADWRLRAWVYMCADADYDTGELRSTCRELALRFDASKSTFARWLTEMEASGYIRRSALGEGPRDGMTLTIVYISGLESEWDKRWDKTGTKGGTRNGTNKSSNDAGFPDGRGTKSGTNGGTKPGQSVGHVLSKEKEEVSTTVPSEQCAQDEADLFGSVPHQPPSTEPESDTAIARRVVTLFHELSKAAGGNGVSAKDWPAQLKMAANALGRGDMDEQAACEALRWGMRQEYQRRRLRADAMKVLRYVWSEWVEETGGETNGNGRSNGTGGVTGNSGTAQTGAGAVPVLVNGRWERRNPG